MLTANKNLTIKYVSPHEPSGYGEAARRYIAGLRNARVKLTWSPMVPGLRWRLGYEPFTGNRIESEFDELCNFPMDYDRAQVYAFFAICILRSLSKITFPMHFSTSYSVGKHNLPLCPSMMISVIPLMAGTATSHRLHYREGSSFSRNPWYNRDVLFQMFSL
jgi:hypothetical protein